MFSCLVFFCSEFEELEAVPTIAFMDGPLEPSSSTACIVTDVPDDPAFVNFFSVCSLPLDIMWLWKYVLAFTFFLLDILVIVFLFLDLL